MADRQVADHKIRELAYYLWDKAGRPEGQHDVFWHEAAQELAQSNTPAPKEPLTETGEEPR